MPERRRGAFQPELIGMEAQALDRLKAVAEQLALALSTQEGRRTSLLLSRLQAAPAQQPALAGDDTVRRIGIWNRTLDGHRLVYERGEQEPWHLWADVQRIEPKQDGTTRILLLGESVARGNDYAPHYSPALVLQSILRAGGLPQAEVLDLARLSIGAAQLLETTRSALALAPDALVVFAGNNWSFLQSTPNEALAFSTPDALELWKSSRRICEELLARGAGAVAATLGEIAQSQTIPVVFLIPEFNLLDWRTKEPEAPLLDAADIARWCELRRATEAARSSGNYAAAESAARNMLELDGGTMAATFDNLLESRPGLAATEQRVLLEQARDAGLGMLREYSPRCERVIQDALRAALPKHNIGVIDLPKEFSTCLGGALPGRNLFLDYVHLNSTGIRISMALAAQWLLPRLTRSSRPSFTTLLNEAPEPLPQTTALANLQAAFVNWTWGQSTEIQRHYCLQALEAHPAGADLLREFIEHQTSVGHLGTCRAFRRLSERMGAAARYSLVVLTDDRDKRCDLGFLDNAVEILETREPGVRAAVTRRLQMAHGVTARGTNLLERYFRVGPVFDFFGGPLLGDMYSRAYYRAFTSKSGFFFVCESRVALSLTVTYRTPEETAPESLTGVHVNGRCILRLPSAPAWQSESVVIDPSCLREGVNDIILHWPQPVTHWRDRLQRMVRNMQLERSGSVYPVYGHLHTLRVEA